MAPILVECGRLDEATEQVADLLAIDPAYNFQHSDALYPYYSNEYRKRMASAIKLAGIR